MAKAKRHPDHKSLKFELIAKLRKQGEEAGLPKDVIEAAVKRPRRKKNRPVQATFNTEETS